MNPISLQRLHNQQLEYPQVTTPEALVGWLGAVQAQEYADAKWALGMRLPGMTDAQVEQAFTDGRILRTHVMRPTWHFVRREDIRWLLALTAPRVHGVSAYYYRSHGLDETLLRRCDEVMARALQGGQQLTRAELAEKLAVAGVEAAGNRLAYIVMHAELEGVVCSGARRGKQFTYALLDERAPNAPMLKRDEALAELVRRYFSSHGPAQVQDFVWWSGLTVADTKAGLEMLNGEIVSEMIGGKTYWYAASQVAPQSVAAPKVYLLHAYDEYGVAYKDRADFLNPAFAGDANTAVYSGYFLIDGQVAGNWKRTFKKKATLIEYMAFRELTREEITAFEVAAKQFGAFLEMPVSIL